MGGYYGYCWLVRGRDVSKGRDVVLGRFRGSERGEREGFKVGFEEFRISLG